MKLDKRRKLLRIARISFVSWVAIQTTRSPTIIVVCLKGCVFVKGGEVHGLTWEGHLAGLCDRGATVSIAVAYPHHSMVQIVVLT